MEKKEAVFVQEFNECCARVITCLREFEKIQGRSIKQCETKTRDCRQKTTMSDYFSKKEALKT